MQKKGNVLVVEDCASAREALREILTTEYDVFVAENGLQALKILSSVHIDTVTLEPWLAGLQGRELLRRIREADPHVRVIIVSGQRLSTWFDGTVRDEVFDYLPKPFEKDDLLRMVARSLVRPHAMGRALVQARGA